MRWRGGRTAATFSRRELPLHVEVCEHRGVIRRRLGRLRDLGEVREEVAVDAAPDSSTVVPATRRRREKCWRKQDVVDLVRGRAVREGPRSAIADERRVGRDVLWASAGHERRQRRGARGIVEVRAATGGRRRGVRGGRRPIDHGELDHAATGRGARDDRRVDLPGGAVRAPVMEASVRWLRSRSSAFLH